MAVPIFAFGAGDARTKRIKRKQGEDTFMSMNGDDNAAAPENMAPAREQGMALMKMGRMAEAVQALQRAVADDANDEQSWRLLGGALSARGDQAGAVRAFEQSAQLAPSSPKSHYNLAVALQATGQLYEAKSHLDQALALNPNYDQARALLDELARQADTRGSGMAQATDDAPLSPAASSRPAAYAPPAVAAGDDLAPVGGPTAFGGGGMSAPGGTSVGGRSAGGDDLASVGGNAGAYAGAPPPPPPPPGGAQTSVPSLGTSPYNPPIPPPGAYAPPPPVLGQAYGYAGANTSGMQGDVPVELQGGWNWGAFGLTFFWLLTHKMVGWAIGFFVLNFVCGLLALPISIYMGIAGNKLAWQNRQWSSVEDCKACQKTWANWAIPLFILGIVIGVAAVLMGGIGGIRGAATGGRSPF